MATTSTRIEIFANGLRDTAGAVVPSGKVRFYNPGTLVQQTVYSDATCATSYPQPITLSAAGQATIYTLEAVRCIAKDSAETTTFYDDVINLSRADSVYMTVPGVNNGAETTVEAAFANVVTGLGADFQYRWMASATATARPYSTAIGERAVSVKDFGALGDDTQDDTAEIQNAINSGAGWIYFPSGTYRISAALTMPLGPSPKFYGSGRGKSIIKNMGTTTDVFDLTTSGGTTDYRIGIQDLSITASTSSTGRAIYVPAAGTVGVYVHRVTVSGHATGIYAGGDKPDVRFCDVTYTGTGAGNYGIYVGSQGMAENCKVTGPGTGGSDTGILISGLAKADTCTVITARIGYSLGTGAGTMRSLSTNCYASGCNTGYSIPAAADVLTLIACNGATNTTDIAYGAGCLNVTLVGCPFATHSGTPFFRDPSPRMGSTSTTSASASVTWTPDLANGAYIQRFTGSYAAAAQNVTVASPTLLASVPEGQLIFYQLAKTGANVINLTWDAVYIDADSSALTWANVSSGSEITFIFRKSGASLMRLMIGNHVTM